MDARPGLFSVQLIYRSTLRSSADDLASERTSRRRAADAKFEGIRVPVHRSEAGTQASHVAVQVGNTSVAPHEQGAGQKGVLAGVCPDQLVLAAEDIGEHLDGRQQGRAGPGTHAAPSVTAANQGAGHVSGKACFKVHRLSGACSI